MPHIILEYSSNLKNDVKFSELFLNIHTRLNLIAGISIENCKSRSLVHEDYFFGRSLKSRAFIHLEIQWFKGRTKELKAKLAEELLVILKQSFQPKNELKDIGYTIYFHDIEKGSYFKFS
ncbi:MAG: 5-carboxymethyl-2-hydroxymuconate Delta-isomerase [Candidatus Hodarchaeales archaeon]